MASSEDQAVVEPLGVERLELGHQVVGAGHVGRRLRHDLLLAGRLVPLIDGLHLEPVHEVLVNVGLDLVGVGLDLVVRLLELTFLRSSAVLRVKGVLLLPKGGGKVLGGALGRRPMGRSSPSRRGPVYAYSSEQR